MKMKHNEKSIVPWLRINSRGYVQAVQLKSGPLTKP